ncbi:MAG: YraN family protein [Acidimicrobiia bacterium]|nr:YraN family protein [Acidimicrobiia bacterium]
MQHDRRDLGRLGESVAASFLEKRGACVLARNVEVGGGELDLVVDFAGERVVVEVRTANRQDVAPELVSLAKESQVRRLAAMLDPPVFRIDIVTVLIAAAGLRIRWTPRI